MSPLSTNTHQESSGASVGDRTQICHGHVHLLDDVLCLRNLDSPAAPSTWWMQASSRKTMTRSTPTSNPLSRPSHCHRTNATGISTACLTYCSDANAPATWGYNLPRAHKRTQEQKDIFTWSKNFRTSTMSRGTLGALYMTRQSCRPLVDSGDLLTAVSLYWARGRTLGRTLGCRATLNGDLWPAPGRLLTSPSGPEKGRPWSHVRVLTPEHATLQKER